MNEPAMNVNKESCRVLLVRDGTNDVEWLRLRRETGIGASESPIICGMSPYGSIVKLYGEKLGLLDPQEENEAMRWGKLLEPVILGQYREETGYSVQANNALFQSIEKPFMLATPDAFDWAAARKLGLVQVKNTGLEYDWKEGAPLRVWCQCQHELYVTDLDRITALALLSGRKLVWIDIPRDDRFINDTLLPRCSEFWSRVVNKEGIPEHWLEGSDDEFAALKAMFPERLEGSTVELGPEFIDVHERMQEMKTLVATAEREIKTMENRFRLAIGEHTYGRLGSGLTYSLKTQTRAEHIVKACTFRVLRLMKGTVN